MSSSFSPSCPARNRAPFPPFPPASAGFEAFAHRLQPLVRGLAKKVLAETGVECPAWIDDLVQDSFCRLLDGGPERFAIVARRGEKGIVTYVASVVRRVAIDQWRAAGAAKRRGRLPPVASGALEATLADARADPEALLLARERLRLLFVAAGEGFPAGPMRRRNVAILRWAWIGGWNSQEISGFLAGVAGGLEATSIDTLLCRVRRKLGEQGISVLRRPTRNLKLQAGATSL